MSLTNTVNKIKVAVIGAGHLGKFHAEKYYQLPECDLVAVCDNNEAQANIIAQKYDAKAVTNYKTLLGKVDAVTIATPTSTHFEIAAFCLQQGIHVLLEKPITTTLQEADELIRLAARNKLILQVGHLERFNSVVQHARSVLNQPLFIESLRIAMFKPRSMDVNVILDLMIHDIDIIQYLVQSKISRISANGAKVATSHVDIGNARLEFDNGAVANVTASRVSLKAQRIFRIFQKDAYISMDLQEKRLAIHQRGDAEMFPGVPEIICDEIDCPTNDALKDQAHAFLNAVNTGSKPLVTGEEGRGALLSALQITDVLNAHNEKYIQHWN
jgi:predicted dehydrogenase